jgi:hypothetical protein
MQEGAGALMRLHSARFDRLLSHLIRNRARSAIFNIYPISNFGGQEKKVEERLPRSSHTNSQSSTDIYMKQHPIL